jgi:hypothetical protein
MPPSTRHTAPRPGFWGPVKALFWGIFRPDFSRDRDSGDDASSLASWLRMLRWW